VETNRRRCRIFMPVDEFERSLQVLPSDEARQAKIDLLREGVEAYWREVNWKKECRPSFWVLCLIPFLWPHLIGRHFLSKSSVQPAILRAIQEYRHRWSKELDGAELSFDGLPGEDG